MGILLFALYVLSECWVVSHHPCSAGWSIGYWLLPLVSIPSCALVSCILPIHEAQFSQPVELLPKDPQEVTDHLQYSRPPQLHCPDLAVRPGPNLPGDAEGAEWEMELWQSHYSCIWGNPRGFPGSNAVICDCPQAPTSLPSAQAYRRPRAQCLHGEVSQNWGVGLMPRCTDSSQKEQIFILFPRELLRPDFQVLSTPQLGPAFQKSSAPNVHSMFHTPLKNHAARFAA